MSHAITQLNGLQLLFSYLMLVAVAAGACRWWREHCDSSRDLLPFPVPENADEYEAGYLRRGTAGLAMAALANLVDRGYLCAQTRHEGWWKREQKYIVHRQDHPGHEQLSPMERPVFEWFQSGRKVDEVFANNDLFALLAGHATPYEEKLYAERLLNGDAVRARARPAMRFAIAALAAAGIWLWIAGTLDDAPKWLLGVVALGTLGMVSAASEPDRLSYRGRTYLEALQQRWAPGGSSYVPAALTAGLFGLALLSGPTFAALAEAYKQSQAGTFQWSSEGGGDGDGCGGCGGCGD